MTSAGLMTGEMKWREKVKNFKLNYFLGQLLMWSQGFLRDIANFQEEVNPASNICFLLGAVMCFQTQR